MVSGLREIFSKFITPITLSSTMIGMIKSCFIRLRIIFIFEKCLSFFKSFDFRILILILIDYSFPLFFYFLSIIIGNGNTNLHLEP